MKLDVVIEGRPSKTVRAQQLRAAFDVPHRDVEKLEWHGDLPIEQRAWNVGLIVGPSGSGKTTIMRNVWGERPSLGWHGDAVVDDFPATMSIEDITAACSAVGFNTIPAWLRPHHVLSVGEQFRVTLARTLVESDPSEPIVMDEFSSVVDRQVAQIGSHAAQKWVRRHDRQFVAVTCHYDVIDWLQPDWVFDPSTMLLEWRHLRGRPAIECEVARVPYDYWELFAPFHYLTNELHRAATCYVLFAGANRRPAAFAGVLHRPTQKKVQATIKGVSRLVTLPDWQGVGLAFALVDRVGGAYKALGYELHTYPAHPALIRSFDRSKVWELRQRPGHMTAVRGPMSMRSQKVPKNAGSKPAWKQGFRPCAVFRYRGQPLDARLAAELTGAATVAKRSRPAKPLAHR